MLNHKHDITITSQQESMIRKAAEYTLHKENYGSENVHVVITDDEEMQTLNFKFKGENNVTDVLSFNSNTDHEQNWPSYDLEFENILGEVVICLPQVVRQSLNKNVNLSRELALLTIHGILHLLGYDHETQNEEHIMFGKTNNILNKIYPNE